MFLSDRGNANFRIYVMETDGSNQTNLTSSTAWHEDPSWSPDGSKIAFTAFREDSFDIYVMDADGSNQTNLTNDVAWDKDPSWSP